MPPPPVRTKLTKTPVSARDKGFAERTAIMVKDHILSAADVGPILLLCLIDLSKFFDVFSHSKLLLLLGIDMISLKTIPLVTGLTGCTTII